MSTASLILWSPQPDYFRLLRGPWTIRTKWHRQEQSALVARPKAYVLCYNRQPQHRILAGRPLALRNLVAQCVHLNAIDAVPRPEEQCAADSRSPETYLKKLAGIRP